MKSNKRWSLFPFMMMLLFSIITVSAQEGEEGSAPKVGIRANMPRGKFVPRTGIPYPGKWHNTGSKNLIWHRKRLLDHDSGNVLPLPALIDILNGQVTAMWSSSARTFGFDTLAIVTTTLPYKVKDLTDKGINPNEPPVGYIEQANQELREKKCIFFDKSLNIYRTLEQGEIAPKGAKLITLADLEKMDNWKGDPSSETWIFRQLKQSGGSAAGVGGSGYMGGASGYILFQHEMGHCLGLQHQARFGSFESNEYINMGWAYEGFRAKSINKSGDYKVLVLNRKDKNGITLSQLPEHKGKDFEILMGPRGLLIAASPKAYDSNHIVAWIDGKKCRLLPMGKSYIVPESGLTIRFEGKETTKSGHELAKIHVELGFDVLNNKKPLIKSFTVEGKPQSDIYEIGVNQQVQLKLDAVEPEGESLTYNWTINDKPTFGIKANVKNGLLAIESDRRANQPTFNFKSEYTGTFNVLARVYDSKGGVAEKTITIKVGNGVSNLKRGKKVGVMPGLAKPEEYNIQRTNFGFYHTGKEGQLSMYANAFNKGESFFLEIFANAGYIIDKIETRKLNSKGKPLGNYVKAVLPQAPETGSMYTFYMDNVEENIDVNVTYRKATASDNILKNNTFNNGTQGYWKLEENAGLIKNRLSLGYGGKATQKVDLTQYFSKDELNSKNLIVTYGTGDVTDLYRAKVIFKNKKGTVLGNASFEVEQNWIDKKALFKAAKKAETKPKEVRTRELNYNYAALPKGTTTIEYVVEGLNTETTKHGKAYPSIIGLTHLSVKEGVLVSGAKVTNPSKIYELSMSDEVLDLDLTSNLTLNGKAVDSLGIYYSNFKLTANGDNFKAKLLNNIPHLEVIDATKYVKYKKGQFVEIPFQVDIVSSTKATTVTTLKGIIHYIREGGSLKPKMDQSNEAREWIGRIKPKFVKEFNEDKKTAPADLKMPPKLYFAIGEHDYQIGKKIKPFDLTKFFINPDGGELKYVINVYEKSLPYKFTTVKMPKGLSIKDGAIVGTPKEVGNFKINFHAENIDGEKTKDIYMDIGIYDDAIKFDLDNTSFEEELTPNTKIGTLSGKGTNANNLVYTVKKGSNTLVAIPTGTNTLVVNQVFDYETMKANGNTSIEISIKATDKVTKKFSVQTFSLKVKDGADKPKGVTLSNHTFEQTAAAGTVVGTFIVDHPNPVTLTTKNSYFKIENNDNGVPTLYLAKQNPGKGSSYNKIPIDVKDVNTGKTLQAYLLVRGEGTAAADKWVRSTEEGRKEQASADKKRQAANGIKIVDFKLGKLTSEGLERIQSKSTGGKKKKGKKSGKSKKGKKKGKKGKKK